MNDIVSLLASTLQRELWIVTAQHASRRGGLVATFVNQASIVPQMPRMVIGLANHHFTRELVEASSCFALHLISEQQLDWVWHFGLKKGRQEDKLLGFPCRAGRTNSPIIEGTLGYLDCKVEASLPIGDRTLYVGEVVDASLNLNQAPLTSQRMLALAPDAVRRQLAEQMQQDIAIDEEAIRIWRQKRA
ncbi:MAG: hypothetical protein KatS3mg105_0160 [Gemmatales bacterium]|nr:MAG: hypothetical protein KatS3mg105_0160 [Gemmatales bacterium]